MIEFLKAFNLFIQQLTLGVYQSIVFCLFIVTIHCINKLTNYRLNYFGLIPREPITLIFGSWLSSFLHANTKHLINNTFVLFCLTSILFAQGTQKATLIIINILLLKSLFVWLFARKAIHIGASGLIMGIFSYLLYKSYLSPNAITIGITILLLYYFSILFFSILPSEKHVSFEGHLSGLISGIIIATTGPYQGLSTISIKLSSLMTAIVH